MYKFTKRLFDIVVSFTSIIILLPICVVLIIWIKLDSKGPVLFKQKRVGKNKEHFMILKFRTMKIDTPKNTPTHLLINPDEWITKVGLILRKTSLDELPQLFNVLKGDMTFVGPRPALWNQYDLIHERDRYNVNSLVPGVTGLAQVQGRDELSIKNKAKLDGRYKKTACVLVDFKILIQTFLVVIKKDGYSEGGK